MLDYPSTTTSNEQVSRDLAKAAGPMAQGPQRRGWLTGPAGESSGGVTTGNITAGLIPDAWVPFENVPSPLTIRVRVCIVVYRGLGRGLPLGGDKWSIWSDNQDG